MTTPAGLKPQWYQILLALADEPRHGLGIRDEVLRQTDDRMRLWPAMLYGSLRRMEEDGLIGERTVGGPGAETDRRRFFALTRKGRQVLTKETTNLAQYIAVAREKRVEVSG